ncbi:MAG: hypothetical protein KAU94_07220 [Verrucomicrobia bacterium]|nr:hypothetical protein [Verrucomicrobiota bacterium]
MESKPPSGLCHLLVEWSKEDQCHVGSYPGLMRGGVHGADEASIYKELCQAVEEWIELCQKDGELSLSCASPCVVAISTNKEML